MANWNDGIRLILSAYDGPEVTITREKNSLSDFVKAQKIEDHFEYVFKSPNFFDSQAFETPPEGSTKGTNLQHYFNNFFYSPSRLSQDLKIEIPKVVDGELLKLPLKNSHVRWKWFIQGAHELQKKLNENEYEKYAKIWMESPIPFLNPFASTLKISSRPTDLGAKREPNGSIHQNIVIYGPPGTGKTRAAYVIASTLLSGKPAEFDSEKLNLAQNPKMQEPEKLRMIATQFHPSFSYEDFFEGMRPVNTQVGEKSEVTYSVVPGVFKIACQLARAYLQPREYAIDVPVKFAEGKWLFEESLVNSPYKLLARPGYFIYRGKNVGITKSTGGKYAIDLSSSPSAAGVYPVQWFYDGDNAGAQFVLFIDELNRGNPARVFGEALSLIEESKRLGQEEEAQIVLPYSHETFIVPPNITIVCAMNSSDKSLANLDQAFRRRFRFIYLAPAFDIVTSPVFKARSKGIFSDEILESLKTHFQAINDALKNTRIPQENFVGHSYLINLLRDSFLPAKANPTEAEKIIRDNLKRTWETELHGLIREVVGDQRLPEFCANFAKEVAKLKSNTLFLALNEDISDSLFKYLENVQPTAAGFPWKRVA